MTPNTDPKVCYGIALRYVMESGEETDEPLWGTFRTLAEAERAARAYDCARLMGPRARADGVLRVYCLPTTIRLGPTPKSWED